MREWKEVGLQKHPDPGYAVCQENHEQSIYKPHVTIVGEYTHTDVT